MGGVRDEPAGLFQVTRQARHESIESVDHGRHFRRHPYSQRPQVIRVTPGELAADAPQRNQPACHHQPGQREHHGGQCDNGHGSADGHLPRQRFTRTPGLPHLDPRPAGHFRLGDQAS